MITVAAVLSTSETTKLDPTEPEFQCETAHESYNLTSEAPLGVYSQYGISVDHHVCSTVAK